MTPRFDKEILARYEYLQLLRVKEEQLKIKTKIEKEIKELELRLNPIPPPIPQLDPEDILDSDSNESLWKIIKSLFKK